MITRLVVVEVRRFFARRLVLLLLAAAFVIIGVVQIVATANPRQNDVSYFRTVCDTSGVPATIAEPGSVEECAVALPSRDRPNLADDYEIGLHAVGGGLVALGVVVGASFLGADFACGAVATLLLYEPGRWRVFISKVAGAAIGMLICGLAVSLWLGLAMWFTSAVATTTSGLDRSWLSDVAGTMVRVTLAGALAAALAVGVCALVRRTGGVIALLFGVAIFEPLVVSRWNFLDGFPPVAAFVGLVVGHWSRSSEGFGSIANVADALRVTVGWMLACCAIGGAAFAHREVR